MCDDSKGDDGTHSKCDAFFIIEERGGKSKREWETKKINETKMRKLMSTQSREPTAETAGAVRFTGWGSARERDVQGWIAAWKSPGKVAKEITAASDEHKFCF